MKILKLCAAAAAIVIGAGAPVANAGPASFDSVLADLETCREPDGIKNMRTVLDNLFVTPDYRFRDLGKANTRMLERIGTEAGLPLAPRSLQVENGDDYVHYRVTIDGSYQGLPIRRIELVSGLMSGWYSWDVEFDAPRSVVEQKFGAAIRKAARRAALSESEPTVEILSDRPAIFCDFSN